jgi:pyruvate/2-oxoglutarate dehydrogenase complex dihydrolipoamide dehydrogenase (E3) component
VNLARGSQRWCDGYDSAQERSGMKNFDPFLVDILVKALKASGIEIHTNMPVNSVEEGRDRRFVRAGKD